MLLRNTGRGTRCSFIEGKMERGYGIRDFAAVIDRQQIGSTALSASAFSEFLPG